MPERNNALNGCGRRIVTEAADSAYIERLVEHVTRKIGLRFSESRRGQIASSIDRVMAKHQIGTCDLIQRLTWDQELIRNVIAAVTVGETSFFRGAEQFALIREEIIPELQARRSSASAIRICSVGCSTGEEPYSIAMLCEEAGIADKVQITAVDVSREALERAKQGEYDAWSLRNMAPAMRQCYFTVAGRRFRLKNAIARQVEFGLLDIAAEELPEPCCPAADFDLVLCRNVLVYYEPAIIKRLAGRLFQSLSKGGWLITAPADPLLSKIDAFEAVTTYASAVYRRPEEMQPTMLGVGRSADALNASSATRDVRHLERLDAEVGK